MDSTTLYYLFSTMAQTVAAATGFLAAFVLVRIQQWDAELTHASTNLTCPPDVTSQFNELYDLCFQSDRTAFDARLREITKQNPAFDSYYHNQSRGLHFETFRRLLPRRSQLVKDFWNALIPAAFATGISLLLIPFARFLASDPWCAWASAIVIMFCCVWTGVKIYKLLLNALRLSRPLSLDPRGP